jgi:hypothetical protein
MADASKKDMVTQLIATAFNEYSILILGKAIFTAAPINGLKKLEVMVTANIIDLFTPLFFCVIIYADQKVCNISCKSNQTKVNTK